MLCDVQEIKIQRDICICLLIADVIVVDVVILFHNVVFFSHCLKIPKFVVILFIPNINFISIIKMKSTI